MKKSNIIGLIAAVIAVAAIVSLISWCLAKKTPVILQGEVNVTSYKASSKIPGRIEKMLIGEGQQVKKGELLYVLSTPEIDAKMRQAQAARNAAEAQNKKADAGARKQQVEAALNMWQKAEAGLTYAQKSYQRVKNLYQEGVVPAQAFDEAEANLLVMQANASAAKAQYDMALAGTRKEDKVAAEALVQQAAGAVSEVEIALNDAFVYSPVDGEVSTVIAEAGELVGAGYPVVTILDMSDKWVTFNIKETLMPKIKIGKKFSAYIPALDKNTELEIYYIAPQADFATWAATRTRGGFDIRTFTVKAKPTSDVADLRPGMSAIADWDKME